MSKDNFVDYVRSKIERKKRIHALSGLFLMVGLTFIISYQSASIILNSRYEKAWVEYNKNQLEYFVWEELGGIEEIDAFSYLVDDMELYELFDELSETVNGVELFKTINMEG